MAVSSSSYLSPTSTTHRRSHHRSQRRKPGLRRKCQMMVKQQKTRFYILGRCVSMLLCWHAHTLSD